MYALTVIKRCFERREQVTDGRSRSLDALLESETIPYGIKLTGGNVGVSGKKVTLPHYMAMFL